MQCGLSTGQSEVAADINCDDDIGHMDTHDDDGALKYKKETKVFCHCYYAANKSTTTSLFL